VRCSDADEVHHASAIPSVSPITTSGSRSLSLDSLSDAPNFDDLIGNQCDDFDGVACF
jgi:hypothetical protein